MHFSNSLLWLGLVIGGSSPALAQQLPPPAPAATGAQAPVAPGPRLRELRGRVTSASNGTAISNARVTLFIPSLSFFREVRSDLAGNYNAAYLPSGPLRLGVSATGFQYSEVSWDSTTGPLILDFALDSETEAGSWSVIGNTLPEIFDATDIAALRPDGYVVFCHNTQDPTFFHPVTLDKFVGPPSSREQGCMNTTLLADGSILFAGGQDGSAPQDFTDAIPWVKMLRPSSAWLDLPDMSAPNGR